MRMSKRVRKWVKKNKVESYGDKYLILYKGTINFRPSYRYIARQYKPYKPGTRVVNTILSKANTDCAAGIHLVPTPREAKRWGNTVVRVLVKPIHLFVYSLAAVKVRAKEIIVDCKMINKKKKEITQSGLVWETDNWVVDTKTIRLKYGKVKQ